MTDNGREYTLVEMKMFIGCNCKCPYWRTESALDGEEGLGFAPLLLSHVKSQDVGGSMFSVEDKEFPNMGQVTCNIILTGLPSVKVILQLVNRQKRIRNGSKKSHWKSVAKLEVRN